MKLKKTVCAVLCAAMILTLFSCKTKLHVFEDFQDGYTDALPERAEDGLTLHAFNWTYAQITANLQSIKNAGFKNVLTMPVQQPKSGGAAWWAFYQPLSMSIGDGSSLGTKQELKELCDKAEELGICILADIVANHMATTDDEIYGTAEAYVKEDLVMYSLVKELGVAPTEEEYADGIAFYAEYNGMTTDEILDYYGEENLRTSVLWQALMEKIAAEAVILGD